jgi:hypothetical protein
MISWIGPIRQPVNGFVSALLLFQNALTQYARGRILLLRGVHGDWGSFGGRLGSAPHRLAIFVAGHFGELRQSFRPFAFDGLPIFRAHFLEQIVFLADR